MRKGEVGRIFRKIDDQGLHRVEDILLDDLVQRNTGKSRQVLIVLSNEREDCALLHSSI